jgi:alpha-tubulin suppressor-like RCC1 family protein
VTDTLVQLALLMAKLSLLSFGGGNVVLAELQREVVGRGWLTNAQFLDSYAVGQMSPGPGTLFVVPIGYLTGGFAGAVVATLAFFAPPAIVALVVASVWTRFRENPWPKSIRTGLLPIASGLSFAAAVPLAQNAILDVPSGLMAGIALLVFWRTSLPTPLVLLAATGIGALLLQPGDAPVALASQPTRLVWAWGANDWGQVGNRAVADATSPMRVSIEPGPGESGAVAVAGGTAHSLVLDGDGIVWAWGNNKYGQLGDGSTADRSRPDRVLGLDNVRAIAAGWYHNLALRTDGTVWAWGFNGTYQLGSGAETFQASAARVEGLSGVVAICAGAAHSLAVDSDGAVWAWGSNRYGSLGDGSFTTRAAPDRVVGLPAVAAVGCGQQHSLAAGVDGSLWAWGANNAGQLGFATSDPSLVPQRVPELTDAVAVAAGVHQSLALTRDGSVWSWGRDGLQGAKGAEMASAPRPALTGGRAISTTLYGSLVLKDDGTIWGWSAPYVGRDMPRFPGQVASLENVVAMSGGGAHFLAISSATP